MFDGELFGQQMVEIVRNYVDAEVSPLREENARLIARIDELEKREPLEGLRGQAGEKGERGEPGEVDMDVVRTLIDEAVSALPAPEKGEPGEAGAAGEPGRDGTVDMVELKRLVDAAVSALPPAERGLQGEPGNDGALGEKGADGASGEPGRDGKDGVGLADALKDADGNLVIVMTDGRTKSLGMIDGKDGQPGENGRDGLGFDDLNVEQIGERTVRFLLKRGADAAEFDLTLPVPIYRGVFKEAEPYEPGDLVTWAGSLWHCNEPKALKPGVADSGWQLAAKAGRPGKDAGK